MRGHRHTHGPQRKDSTMRVCLFEDNLVADLEPLSLTRPAFAPLCGCLPLSEKQYRHFTAHDRGVLLRPCLAAVHAEQEPTVHINDLAWLRSGPVVMVNGRWLPPAPGTTAFPDL